MEQGGAVITHYRQRGHAEIIGYRADHLQAACPGVQMKLHRMDKCCEIRKTSGKNKGKRKQRKCEGIQYLRTFPAFLQ